MFLNICLVFLAAVALSTGKAVSYEETTDVSDLVAVVQVFRHGQRTPVYFYTNDPYSDSSYWNDLSTGQLTNVGKQQHYELGQFTRRRYTGFLPEKYNNDDFYAQTTDVDRTHMSGQSNLAGLFPPTDDQVWNEDLLWQPIPLHPSDSDIISGSPDCEIYTAESANVLVNAEEFIKYNEEYADVYAYLTENSGVNVTTVQMAYIIYDALMIENQVGLELDSWTDSVFHDPLRTLTAYAFTAFTYTDVQKRLMAGRWLNEVAEYFTEMAADSTSSQKYQMYSAHDTNIAAILNTLGAFNPHYPSFASTIYFELRNKSGVATVNVWHRNDGVFEAVTVKGCDFDCPLDNFTSVLSTWLVDADAWEAECALNTTSLTDLSTIQASSDLASVHAEVVAHFNRRRPKTQQLNHGNGNANGASNGNSNSSGNNGNANGLNNGNAYGVGNGNGNGNGNGLGNTSS